MGSYVVRLRPDGERGVIEPAYECGWCHAPFWTARALVNHVRYQRECAGALPDAGAGR